MYGVLYALTPELFPTKDRGTGNALVASANRIFGIMVKFLFKVDCRVLRYMQAPLVALYANIATTAPIFISGALFLIAGFIALLLPFEPRGKASA
jgi:hypothetical protein